MNLFQLRSLTRVYTSSRRTITALDNINLDISSGDRLGVIGESGSGKSTLARLLVALDQPTNGEIFFDGQKINGKKERDLGELRSRVQFIFQDPNSSLNPRMKIGRIITEPLRSPLLRNRSDIPTDHEARCRQVLQQVDLEPEMAQRYPHEFSGGQRQRIAIARALVAEPEVIIADEPVSALDVSVRAQILNLLNDLTSEMKFTLVVVSHDLFAVRELCDRVVVLKRGQIIEQGYAAQVFENPKHSYTQELLAAIPSFG